MQPDLRAECLAMAEKLESDDLSAADRIIKRIDAAALLLRVAAALPQEPKGCGAPLRDDDEAATTYNVRGYWGYSTRHLPAAREGWGMLSEIQKRALEALGTEGAVLWPHRCDSVREYARGADGRVHFVAPIEDAFALFADGLIDRHGVITSAGRAALAEEKL